MSNFDMGLIFSEIFLMSSFGAAWGVRKIQQQQWLSEF